MLNKIKALLNDRRRMKELILYLVFGVLTTLVSWGVYYLWRQAFHLTSLDTESARYVLITNSGQVIAFILSVMFAFFTNRKYVFDSKKTLQDGLLKEMWMFFSARILSWVLFDLIVFNLLLLIFKNSFADADLWIKLFNNVLVVIFNYAASKFIIFKK